MNANPASTARRRTSMGLLVTAVVLAALVVVAGLLRLGPAYELPLDRAAMQADGGAAYRLAVEPPRFSWFRANPAALPDRAFAPRRSKARLFEDGREIGVPHADEDAIRADGGGRFRYWRGTKVGTYLLFSTADGSDPRSNGRAYTLRFPATPAPALLGVVLGAGLAAAVRLYLLSPALRAVPDRVAAGADSLAVWRVLLGLASAYVAWLMVGAFPHVPIMSPDSGSYLSWHPIRSVGYPLFLSFVGALDRSFGLLPGAQLVLYLAAVWYLFESLARLTRPLVGGVAALALLAYGPVLGCMLWMLSEPLYLAAILGCAAAGCAALGNDDARRHLLVLAACATVTVLVRPAGYFVPAALVFLAIAWREGTRRVALWGLLPMVVMLGIATSGAKLARGDGTQAIGGMALFPYVAHLFDPARAAPADRAVAAAIAPIAERYRGELAEQRGWRAQFLYSANNFNTVLGQVGQAVAASGALTEGVGTYNAALWRLATTTIRAEPGGYLAQVTRNVAGGWALCFFANYGLLPATTLAAYQHSARTSALRIPAQSIALPGYDADALAAAHPVLTRPGVPFVDRGPAQMLKTPWLRYTVGVASLLAALAALTGRIRARPALAFAWLGALLHGGVALTAAATVYIPRYALPLEPLAIVLFVLGVELLWRAWRARRAGETAAPVGAAASAPAAAVGRTV